MWLLRLLFLPEFGRSLGQVRASAGRIGDAVGALWRVPSGSRLEAGRFRSRRGAARLVAGLSLVGLGVALGAGVAWGQGFQSDLFDIVDEASRDLFDLLRGGDGGGNAAYAALGEMVGYFNAGVLILAGVLLIYHTAAGVMDTGRTGRLGFGGWEIVRIVASVALLVPLPGGPSGGQHIVLDLAGVGGDFAQSVWKPFSGSLLGSSGVSAPKPSAEGREVMMVDFLVVEVCRELAGKRLATGPLKTTARGGQVWRYDVAQGTGGYDIRSHCGEVRFAGLDREGPRGDVARAHLNGMEEARQVLVPVAKRIAEPYEDGQRFGEPMDWSAVSAAVAGAVDAYSGVVDAAVERAGAEQNSQTREELAAEQAEDGSWTTAGSLFFRVAARIGEFNWAVVSAPEVTPPMLALKDRDRKSFKALLQISEDISTAVGTPVSALGSRAPQSGSAGGGAGSMLSQLFYTVMFSFEDVLDVQGDNPISELAAIGHNLVTGVLVTSGTLMSVAAVSNLGDVQALGFSLKADLFEATWPVIDGIVTMVLMALLIGGAVLAYLVPALPFIRFLFGLLVWILAVVEAFIAMTVWLAAQTARTEGSGLTTSSTVGGLVTLAGVVLRPPLMIFGLIVGYLVFTVVIELFNAIWLTQMQGSSGEIGPGIIQYAVFVALYVMIAYGLLNASLKLIEMLPDAVMNWIGGRASGVSEADRMIGVATGSTGRLGGVTPSRLGAGVRNRPGAGGPVGS